MIKTWHIVTFALLFTLIISSKPLASDAKQPAVRPEMTPTIVVSPEGKEKYPVLQGASCGTIGPQGEGAAPCYREQQTAPSDHPVSTPLPSNRMTTTGALLCRYLSSLLPLHR